MVGAYAQIGKQQLLAAGVRTSAVRLHRNKYRVDVFERPRIIGLQNPALLAHVIFIEDTPAVRLLAVRAASPPGLELARVLNTGDCVQIECVENQSLPLCVENAPVGLCGSLAGNVVDIRHV